MSGGSRRSGDAGEVQREFDRESRLRPHEPLSVKVVSLPASSVVLRLFIPVWSTP